jgi:hypothetical protein
MFNTIFVLNAAGNLLYVVTYGPKETDNTIWMITVSEPTINKKLFGTWPNLSHKPNDKTIISDHIKQLLLYFDLKVW